MFSTEGCRAAQAGLLLLIAAMGAACSVYEEGRLQTNGPASSAGQGAAGFSGGDSDAQVPDAALTDCTGEAASATCARANALTACVEGDCVLVECTAPFVDCDGRTDNGCEARLDSLEHCGLCGARCALPGADARCVEGRCELAGCRERYGDCDDEAGNGCETSLVTLDDCGACGRGCDPFEHAAPGCFAGSCGVSQCLGLFGDCDGEAENGCEESLRNTTHCGACGNDCAPSDAVGNCDTGACAIVECEGDAVDCNGLVGDGCEADLSLPEQCGACGAACELPPHATAVLCAPDETPRCQVNHRCVGEGPCEPGAPGNGCEDGYSDCDGDSADGCETRLGSLSDCGGCGDRCAIANAISACEDGACAFMGCERGFDQCGSEACSSLASDEAHCGSCDNECPGSAPNCYGGRCTDQSCTSVRADCNDTPGDGCETRIDTIANCGQCGLACGPYSHATPACSAGRCGIGDCDAGFADCDGVASNGCEVDLRTLDDCGGCRAVCNVPFAEESCERGRCELVQCEPTRADCNEDLADGCETSVLLPDNCGACGNDCTALPNVLSGGCSEGQCSIVCKEGFGDCDGDPSNGCEGAFDSGEHCGACGNDCTALPNVVRASCDGTLCGELECEPGFGDCDGITENGCERPLNTQDDCSECNKPCAPAHGAGECGDGQCRVTSCDTGYDDCNGEDADGCEASLALPAHCGSCQNDCGDQPLCENGKCGCTEDAQCGSSSLSCCDNSCVNTNSVCSLWPCPVASTRRELLHCGGCGVFCPDAAAFFCCGALGE